MSGALLALLLACGGEAPTTPAPAQPPPPTAAPVAPPPVAPAVARVWSAENIDQLKPVPAAREGRSPKPIPADPLYDKVLELLAGVVDRYGGDPANPWAVTHGILARGKDFKLTNGEPAVDWLFSQYAEELTAGGHTLVSFPRSRGEVRIEPHSALILKQLTELGVDPNKLVLVKGRPHPVADLYRGVLLGSYLVPDKNHSSFDSPNDTPWALSALSAWAPPGPLEWRALDGTPMRLDDLATFGVTVLVSEDKVIADAMSSGADFEKKGQGIFKYTCGGAHILQGAAYAVARGRSTPKARSALLQQIPVWFYRLPKELILYDEAAKKAPDQEVRLLVQRLKFTGHFLESMEKMAAMGLFTPDEAQQKMLIGAAQQIVLTVQALHQRQVFNNMEALRKGDEQLYLDVVGDSAHAMRGLGLALGTGSVWY
jgi:hypothetical protein